MAPAGIGDRLEGVHAVAAAMRKGRVTVLHAERSRLESGDVADLVAAATASGIRIEVVDDVRPLAVTTAPQGVVAHARPIPLMTLESAVGATLPPALVVLDHLEDPRNVGAVARSCLAAGIRAMVVPSRRAAPLGPTAFKSAAGALEDVGIVMVNSVADAVARLRKLDVWTLGLAADAEQSLFGHGLLVEPVALVIGSEGTGMGRLAAARVDATARIPVVGPVESLNASVAASLAVFELARARGWVT